MLTLKASHYIVSENVGSGLGVQTSEERGGGYHSHVGVVKALVGAKRVQTTDGCTIDQAGRDIVKLLQCKHTSLRLARCIG